MIIDVMSAVMMTGMRMIVADVKEDSTGDHWDRPLQWPKYGTRNGHQWTPSLA